MIDNVTIETTIRENLSEWDFCVDRLSDMLHVSHSYLRRLVWRYYGLPPHKLIQKMRIELAVELIRTGHKIKAISKSSGYNSVRSFRNAFENEIGMSPSRYKNQNTIHNNIQSKKEHEKYIADHPSFKVAI